MSSEASNNSNKSPQPERLVSGSTFDGEPYEVALETTEVARGASGKVFRGEMVGSPPRIVAVKVIPGLFDPVLEAVHAAGHLLFPVLTSRQLLARELRTARAVSTLHPHILPFLGTANVGGRTAIVSTFMDNGNLKQYIKIHSGSYIKKPIVQVAEAVNFLHWTAGLVHGDIKCENILISNSGDALLADFGLSTFAEKSQSATTTMTAIRQMNTLQFAAPELLLGEGTTVTSKTRESDVYAFGMLVLEAVSGELPWPNHSSLAVMHKVCSGQHPARPTLDGLFVSGSHLWWQTCRSCWRFNPVERPRITDVLRALTPTEPVPSRDLPVRKVMTAATYMPDGKTIAAASEESIMLFTPATGHIRDLWRPGKAVPRISKGGLAVSPDSRHIACYVNDTIMVLNAAFGTLLASIPHDGLLSCVAYSRDGTRIASGARSSSVRLWDAATGAPVDIGIWDVEDGNRIGAALLGASRFKPAILSVAFSPDGTSLVYAMGDIVREWDLFDSGPGVDV